MGRGPTFLPLRECDDRELCGGKACNLGRLMRAGLPVPDGFVVTTTAFGRARPGDDSLPGRLAAQIADAYRRMGSPAVAVRSSGTTEDVAQASLAGQYATVLNVSGERAVLEAVRRCWWSVSSRQVQDYLTAHGIDPDSAAMAVIVQELVPAEVAGVLFTADPRTGDADRMLIEAAWGLGDVVVSGAVQPDVVVLDRASGRELSYVVGDKAVWLPAGASERQPVADQKRRLRCVKPNEVRALWQLARRVTQCCGADQDVEWALVEGQPVVLQTRPITVRGDGDAARQCLQETRDRLQRLKTQGRGDWVRHNIAETLPRPTPLTWSVISRFMSGSGGFGQLYRTVGFEPAERVCREGFLELIAGHIYADLALAAEMYGVAFPFRYDTDLLRWHPEAAQQLPTLPAGSWLQRAEAIVRLAKVEQTLRDRAAHCDRRLREEIVPQFSEWARREKQRDLTTLSADQWCQCWQEREQRVMDRLAPEVLLPGMIAGMGIERLRLFLEEHFWDDNPHGLLRILAVGERADTTIEAHESLRVIGDDPGAFQRWLECYGHRGPEEFDLAAARWRERPAAVRKLADRLAASPSPLARYQEGWARALHCAESLRAGLSPRYRRQFDELLTLVGCYLPWREDGKAVLMLGYDLLRDLALEASRRLSQGADVFLLSFAELCEALARHDQRLISDGDVVHALIRQRRQQRSAEQHLALPPLIDAAAIEHLGQPQPRHDRSLPALSISSGSCTGAVRTVRTPDEAEDSVRGCVLVCPSSDPSWTPLFMEASGIVLECGGMLSHGAIVARELGIPAVVLPGAARLLKDGQTVTVDAESGAVLRGSIGDETRQETEIDPSNMRIEPDQIPPPRGPGERRSALLRNVFLVVWGVYLTAVFLLPRSLCFTPSIKILDALLWPLVTWFGKPGAVAIVAGALALVTIVGQRLLTDNRRLLAVKHRAGRLRREATRLPAGSPRRTALKRAAAGVQPRLLGAALVPVAVLLGPLVMVFLWLPARIDPASWNPPPGAVARITATVDGNYEGPVRLSIRSDLTLDEDTPAVQSPPPVRRVLRRLLARWQREAAASNESSSKVPAAMVADLERFLAGPLPPQTLTWNVRTPDRPGRYPLAVVAGKTTWLQTAAVVGDRFPPEPREDLGDGRGPVQMVRAADGRSAIRRITVQYEYPRKVGDRIFLAPFGWVPLEFLPDAAWRQWDLGWLLTYLIVYLLTLIPVRRLMRLP